MDTTQAYDRSVSIQYLPYAEELDAQRALVAGKFLFPKFGRLLEPFCKTIGKDKYRYSTGLETTEYPEEQHEEIIKAREKLEAYFQQELTPTNVDFWKEKVLTLDKKTTFLNLDDPEHLLIYYMIKGGAFGEIAPSYEAATSGATPKRWYVIDAKEYADIGAEDVRKLDKAIATLVNIEDAKGFDDLFLIHKVLISSDKGITKRSPKSMIYKDLSDFIHGSIVKTNKKQTAKQFIEVAEMLKKDKKKVTITALVKEANYFGFLSTTEEGQFKNLQTGTKYGTTLEKVAAYLGNPANQSELDNIRERVEEKWNR